MNKVPTPGVSVRGSSTGVAIMAAFDLLGRRWTMRILWELAKGDCSFRELQQRCGNPSPTILNTRLKELRTSQIVVLDETKGYGLTELGRELNASLGPLRKWAAHWQSQVEADGSTPGDLD